MAITSSSKDLDTAITLIRTFDPSGYTPGIFLPQYSRLGYFAVKSFFIASQLQSSDVNRVIKNHSSLVSDSTTDTIDFWRRGIQDIYDKDWKDYYHTPSQQHPTLRLLQTAIQEYNLSQQLLMNIIDARFREILFQHETINDMVEHSAKSYGSLLELLLECSGITRLNNKNDDFVYDTARNVGIATGLSSALRSSIPLASSGTIVIPRDLCDKYHVRNPRYLLSVLGQGDDNCQMALRHAVADLVNVSRVHLDMGRKNRATILSRIDGSKAVKCFLPGIAAETFLNRLERSEFNLTDSNLRNIGVTEYALCSGRMWKAALFRQF